MRFGKYNVHAHAITVHFTNALYPVAMFFLFLVVAFDYEPFRHVYFYTLLLATLSTPVSYLSGIIEWKQKYRGARVRIFLRKYQLGIILMILGAACTVWYILDPSVLDGGKLMILFLTMNFSILLITIYLGYLGGKLVFSGGH